MKEREIAAELRKLADRLETQIPPHPVLAVGDLVKCVSDGGWSNTALVGSFIGVVRTYNGERYGVEFAGWFDGHTLNGAIRTTSGYYLSADCLKKCNP